MREPILAGFTGTTPVLGGTRIIASARTQPVPKLATGPNGQDIERTAPMNFGNTTAQPAMAFSGCCAADLQHGYRVTGRSCRAHDWQWREDISKDPRLALDQPLEGHALVKMDAVLHNEMLMTGMEDVRIDGRHDLDREIVRAHHADLEGREPASAFEADSGRAVIVGLRLGIPTRAVARAHEHGVAGRDDVFRDPLSCEACLEIRELNLLADFEHTTFQPLHVEQHAAREERRSVLHPELLQAVGRPHVGELVAVIEKHVGLVAGRTAHAAEMAERVHLRADLADLGSDELIVPDRPALAPVRAAGRAAGHAQGIGASRRDRHPHVVGHAQADDLSGLYEPRRLQHFRGRHEIAVPALVVRSPAGVRPIRRKHWAQAPQIVLPSPALPSMPFDGWRGACCSRGAVGLRPPALPLLRRLHREPDRQDQHRAVEEGLDEERRAELVETRNRDRQHGDGEHRPPHIHAPRPHGGRAEQRRGEGRQQIFLPDRALANLELRLQHDACEGGKRSGGDEGRRNITPRGNAVQFRGARAGAEHVEIAAKRQEFEHDPQCDAHDQRIDGRGRHRSDAT